MKGNPRSAKKTPKSATALKAGPKSALQPVAEAGVLYLVTGEAGGPHLCIGVAGQYRPIPVGAALVL